jgi:neuron navigator 2
LESVLHFVSIVGVSTEGVTAKDLRDGQLRPILRLLFELSRFKQKDGMQAPRKEK